MTSHFTNQVFYVRNIPLCNSTINKITVIITAITIIFIITIIIIIVIIFNFNIPIIIIIIIIIIITIIIKSTIVIIIILSLFLYFFNIKSLCVIFVFEFISVFLTTCFLLFTGFRCNILFTYNSIDLSLLALVFLKNSSTFNKQFLNKIYHML